MKNLYQAFFIIILMSSMSIAARAQSLSGEWKLVEAKQNGKRVALGRRIRTNMVFGEENRAAGNPGCNRYSTVYKLAGKNRIEFEPLISTRMACQKNDFMRQENIFFSVMEKVEKYEIKGNYLIFSDPPKRNILRFAQAFKESLAERKFSNA